MEARTDFSDGLCSITDAARKTGLGVVTIRHAIRRGDLPAFLIGGRPATHSGPGLGYRIKIEDLEAWFWGTSLTPANDEPEGAGIDDAGRPTHAEDPGAWTE